MLHPVSVNLFYWGYPHGLLQLGFHQWKQSRDLRYGYRQTLSQATSVILVCMLGGHQTENRLKLDLERGWCFSSAGYYREPTTRYLLYCWTFRTLAAKHLCMWNNSNGFPESLNKGVIREWGQHESCLHSYSVEEQKVLSTIMWPTSSQTVERKHAERWYQITIQCLDAVVVYNKYLEDQLWHYYRITTKWVKYIFWFLVDVIITNVYILSVYSPVTSTKSLKFLQLTLTTQLIGNYCTRKKTGHPRSTQSISHPPAPLSPLEHNGNSFSQLFCQWCGILFHCGYFWLSWVCVFVCDQAPDAKNGASTFTAG